MFISPQARLAFEDLWKAIDKAPIIPPCQTTDPDVWFAEQGSSGDYRNARKLCQRCPVVQQCLTYALENEESFGVWGGRTPKERWNLKRKKTPIH